MALSSSFFSSPEHSWAVQGNPVTMLYLYYII